MNELGRFTRLRAARAGGLARLCLGAAALLALPTHAGAAGGQTPEATAAVAYGARLYRIYCQSCHGEHGRGDGPVARELDLKLPDLRKLAKRSPDGQFPSARAAAVIDGRESADGHGTRDMPVWGLTFRDPGLVAERESDVEERVRSLVAYLRSLQESTDGRR